jgi:DNA-binding NtrC family response regulator
MSVLMDHRWPGNVRELENAVERAVVLATEEVVGVNVLPQQLVTGGSTQSRAPIDYTPAAGASLPEMVEDFERRIVIQELERSGWSQTEAAKRLRVALSTLNQKIQRLGIDIKKLRGQG